MELEAEPDQPTPHLPTYFSKLN